MQGSKGAIPKRTRAQVGTTNRRRVDDSTPNQQTPSPTPQRSSPKPYNPAGEDRQSTVMAGTVSSLSKLQNRSPTLSSNKPKKEKDKRKKEEETGSPLTNLEVMQCKFIETFEEGKNNIRLGETYQNHSPYVPPTRFSPAPPPGNTSHLTTGERGSPAYIAENDRLATTYNTTIHAFREEGEPVRRFSTPTIVDENAHMKAQAKVKEAGRLARIRENNARVDAVNQSFQDKLQNDTNKRLSTVKKQQESYAQAIAVREARGGE